MQEGALVAKQEKQAAAIIMRAEKETVAPARTETQAVTDQVHVTAAALAEREVMAVATKATHALVGEAAIIKEAQISTRESQLLVRESQSLVRKAASWVWVRRQRRVAAIPIAPSSG